MRFTDQGVRAFPFENGQREYAEDSGLIVRVGKRTKTFMVRAGSRTGASRWASIQPSRSQQPVRRRRMYWPPTA